ncbi:MAG: RHS repeat-associated core domain-containing protein [Candidatus Limnocylindrales bacterium]
MGARSGRSPAVARSFIRPSPSIAWHGTYSYDRAKRPIGLSIKFGASVSGTIARTYDRVGNALSETQTLTGVTTTSGLAGSSTATFAYDAAGRLTSSYFGSSQSPVAPRAYTYDRDSNRTSVTESGTVFYYFYDATDELIKKGPNPDGSGASAFVYDSLGQLLTSQPSQPGLGILHPTTYAYDPAGHLSAITADGVTTSFTIDALGRHAGQTVGSNPTTTYAYLGTSDTISSTLQSGTVSYSAIDAIGDRLTTGTSSAFAYLLPDLHGNVVATIGAGSSPAYSSAYRYDAYGETCDSYTPTGAITSPWRFQGRILESSSGSTDLYDFSARSYDPSLGAFTSFDSVSGSAQNPLTLNRFLYADANPATLVDPDGHGSLDDAISGWHKYEGVQAERRRQSRTASAYNSAHDMSSSVYGYFHENEAASHDMSSSVYNWQQSLARPSVPINNLKPGPCADPSRWCGNTNTVPSGPSCWANNSCGYNPDAGAAADACANHAIWDVGCDANDVNHAWQATGGAVVNYGISHPAQVLAVALPTVACLAGAVFDPLCDLFLASAAGGLGFYALQHSVSQLGHGRSPLDDINLDEVATDTLIGEATAGTGSVLSKAYGAALGSEAAAIWPTGAKLGQWAWDLTVAGPLAGVTNIGLSHLAGMTSPVQDACGFATSLVPGKWGVVGGAMCGLVP